MSDDALRALAAKAGVDTDWTDVAGKRHSVSPETLRAVLRALGLACETPGAIAGSMARLSEQEREVPPLLTAWAGDDIVVDGQTIGVPRDAGYHRLDVGGVERTVAVAPVRAFSLDDVSDANLAGMSVQLYGLRGGHTAGFGDFAALAEFAQSAARRGIDAIAVSPTHALFTAIPSHYSPYSPSSRQFLNPLYTDLGLVGGDVSADDGKDGLIDWPLKAAEKFAALRRAYENGLNGDTAAAFERFCAEGGERLLRHAIFETLHAHFRKDELWTWRTWPNGFREARSRVVAEFARAHHKEVEYHRFLQFLAAKSAAAAQACARAAGMRIGVIADLATGIDPNGSDAWGAPEDVLIGLTIGAPPDYFNARGQGWGLTALSPVSMRSNGFAAFIAMLRANMIHAGGIRIDHAMSLMRLWVIPEGAEPTEGAYLRYPVQDLMRLVSLESHRNRAIVIGEDLGTVPEGFRDRLAHHGMSGMQVLWFERDHGWFIPRHRWRKDAVAMITTHDLPTVAGWWTGCDIAWRSRLGLLGEGRDQESEQRSRDDDRGRLWSALRDGGCAAGDPPPADQPEPAIEAALAYIGGMPSRLALAAIEDMLALPEQPNLPSTIDEHPNWRRRMPPGDPFAMAGAEYRLERFTRARHSR